MPVGKQFEPDPGSDKWILKKDHSVEVLYKEFEDIAAGGWRNKVWHLALRDPQDMPSGPVFTRITPEVYGIAVGNSRQFEQGH